VPGSSIVSGGAENAIGGGSETPICTDTCAIVGIATEITNAKSIAPKSNFFMLFPPLSISDAI
jgi:hypothetical protein